MGWSGYTLTIIISVDAHAGEKQMRGEKLHEEFLAKLRELCDDKQYNNDAIEIYF